MFNTRQTLTLSRFTFCHTGCTTLGLLYIFAKLATWPPFTCMFTTLSLQTCHTFPELDPSLHSTLPHRFSAGRQDSYARLIPGHECLHPPLPQLWYPGRSNEEHERRDCVVRGCRVRHCYCRDNGYVRFSFNISKSA